MSSLPQEGSITDRIYPHYGVRGGTTFVTMDQREYRKTGNNYITYADRIVHLKLERLIND